jgi:AbrB family looped-hinge helix DNA binding protein
MATVVKVDEKGRVVIPKSLREIAELEEGRYVKVTSKEKGIIIEPLEPAADKYLGAFKIARWPKDLDEFVVEAMKKWWISQGT